MKWDIRNSCRSNEHPFLSFPSPVLQTKQTHISETHLNDMDYSFHWEKCNYVKLLSFQFVLPLALCPWLLFVKVRFFQIISYNITISLEFHFVD